MVRSGDSSGQGLLAYGKRILELTTAKELFSTIAEAWQYQDRQCALRWILLKIAAMPAMGKSE